MIFAKSFEEVSPSRFEGKLFNGSMYARTNYLGAHPLLSEPGGDAFPWLD